MLPINACSTIANCDSEKLVCPSCQFAKQHRRPTKVKRDIPRPEKESEIKRRDLFPGQRVSVDHHVSLVPGRIYSSRGCNDPDKMYHGGTIFFDHASGFIGLRHQVSLSAADSIKAKLSFDVEAKESAVTIQAYHTDNGTFSSREYMCSDVPKLMCVHLQEAVKSNCVSPHIRPLAIEVQ